MLTLILFALLPCLFANMNNGGIHYKIGNPSNNGVYSTDFTDEYFDVYGEVQTRYSQVFWTRSDNIPLPADIVNRFKGKVMAITGYEVDQVYKTPHGDKSVPIYHAYNHHYFGWLLGQDAEMVRSEKPVPPLGLTYWTVRDKPNNHGFPTNIVFKENPGGEFRKSYHGYPKGYAQLLHSPTYFVTEPMQIDTHNRAYKGPGYKPWFYPKSIAGLYDPNSGLDPLIECPCTDRITKVVTSDPVIQNSGNCANPITNADDCFTEVKSLVTVSANKIVSDHGLPPACLMSPDSTGKTYTAIFNTAQSTQTCGPSKPEVSGAIFRGHTSSLVDLSLAIDVDNNLVTITMTGPSGVWFGVGFNAGVMADQPYTIVVDGTGGVTERKLANHDPGVLLSQTVKVVSRTSSGSNLTVVLQRSIVGVDPAHFTFPTNATTLKFICAYGSGPDFDYHQDRTASIIVLTSNSDSCVCEPLTTTYLSYMNASSSEYKVYCAPEPRGDMAAQVNPACQMQTYHGGLQCCHHEWFLTDVDQEHLIPPDVDTYYLKFRFYFQEYIPGDGSNPPSHYHLHHWVFLIDAEINDYEEVKCTDGNMCEGFISAHLTAKNMGLEDVPNQFNGIMPLVIAAHCHAPSCIRQELVNADTGELICRVTAEYGTGIEPFNEKGYVALPPCLFGHQDGLRPPVVLTPDTNLTAIKVFNTTFRHLGQMAQWTGLMVYLNNGVIEDGTPKVASDDVVY